MHFLYFVYNGNPRYEKGLLIYFFLCIYTLRMGELR